MRNTRSSHSATARATRGTHAPLSRARMTITLFSSDEASSWLDPRPENLNFKCCIDAATGRA